MYEEKQEKRIGQISNQCMELNKAIEILDKLVSTLVERLDVVLISDEYGPAAVPQTASPGTCEEKSQRQHLVAVAEELRGYTDRIHIVNRYLDTLLQRLEL